MTLDDGTPGMKRRLNLLALGAVVIVIIITRACVARDRPAALVDPEPGLDAQGTSVTKDHGASAADGQR